VSGGHPGPPRENITQFPALLKFSTAIAAQKTLINALAVIIRKSFFRYYAEQRTRHASAELKFGLPPRYRLRAARPSIRSICIFMLAHAGKLGKTHPCRGFPIGVIAPGRTARVYPLRRIFRHGPDLSRQRYPKYLLKSSVIREATAQSNTADRLCGAMPSWFTGCRVHSKQGLKNHHE
jgi:hypothetical protein